MHTLGDHHHKTWLPSPSVLRGRRAGDEGAAQLSSFGNKCIFLKVNSMVFKPRDPSVVHPRQNCVSFYLRPLGSSYLSLACCAALVALCTVCPPALAAQERLTEAEAPVVEAPLAPEKAAAVKVASEAKPADDEKDQAKEGKPAASNAPAMVSVSKASVLVGSFTVFLLAVFVGFEIIAKVPPTLHTPLMSGSNAISGITVVGAMIAAGAAAGTAGDWFGTLLGVLAVVLAMINVVGGFVVTHRMLKMFKKR